MKSYFDKLYKKDLKSFYLDLVDAISSNKKMFIITANPETFMVGYNNSEMNNAIQNKHSIIVPDGIGIIKAARYLGYKTSEKITGVDLAVMLLDIANKQGKKVYLYGASEEVNASLALKIKKEYPNIIITGNKNGYDFNDNEVMAEAIQKESDIIFAALGIPRQEILISKHIDKAQKGIFIGVGGSFDVISGSKKRAPQIFINHNLEWLYRIGTEPKRLKRFYNSNIKFVKNILKLKTEIKEEKK